MSQVPLRSAGVEARVAVRWAADHVNEPDSTAAPAVLQPMMFPILGGRATRGEHVRFTGADIYGRFRRLQGHDVFEPIGSTRSGFTPRITRSRWAPTRRSSSPRTSRRSPPAASLRRHVRLRHELSTTDPGYTSGTQWIFVQLFKRGWRSKKAAVNWLPQGHERRRERAGDQRLLRAPSRHQG